VKVGDIVRVRLKQDHKKVKIGILLEEPKQRYMTAGHTVRIMVEGRIRVVKCDHLEVISESR